jgi:UDP-N-acetylglucosamine 4-epimerase
MTQHASPSRYQLVREELMASPRVWLVTGAAGFIGSNLVEELLALGQSVVGLDNFSTGHEANLIDAVGTGAAAPNFRFIEGDIRDLAVCRAACSGVDYVLHHAAVASVPLSISDPLTSCRVNIEGFLDVLVAARDSGVRRVVYASSSAVYGDTKTLPQTEHDAGRALSPYAATKATNEVYASVFERTYGLGTVGLRYYNVFGRRQDPSGAYAAVIPRWVSNLLRDEPCEIYGDGEASRDFCYVANAVQANLLAATAQGPNITGEAFNVACGQETSLNELFEMIRLGLTMYQPSVVMSQPRHLEPRQGDIRRSVADISRARRLLGYEPTHRTAAGLHQALAWYAARSESVDADAFLLR